MAETAYRTALIVGVGAGLSASLARIFTKAGLSVALAARRASDLAALAKETGGKAFTCDATNRADVAKLFADVEANLGGPDVVVYNPSYRTRGPFVELNPDEVAKSITVSAFGGFLVAQEAARRMLPRGRGAILFTGASASVKGYAQSAPFAMGKFALRGLAQIFSPANFRRKVSTLPTWSSTAAFGARAVPIRPTDPTARLTPMTSRRPTSTFCSSTAVPGRGRSRCGRGSRGFEPADASSRL